MLHSSLVSRRSAVESVPAEGSRLLGWAEQSQQMSFLSDVCTAIESEMKSENIKRQNREPPRIESALLSLCDYLGIVSETNFSSNLAGTDFLTAHKTIKPSETAGAFCHEISG